MAGGRAGHEEAPAGGGSGGVRRPRHRRRPGGPHRGVGVGQQGPHLQLLRQQGSPIRRGLPRPRRGHRPRRADRPGQRPGVCGRLFDRGQSHPQAVRLALWHSLERGAGSLPDAVVTAHAEKVAAIAQAQDAGRVSNRFPAAELLVLVVGLATMGAAELAPAPDPALRRRTVTQAVELLTKDEA